MRATYPSALFSYLIILIIFSDKCKVPHHVIFSILLLRSLRSRCFRRHLFQFSNAPLGWEPSYTHTKHVPGTCRECASARCWPRRYMRMSSQRHTPTALYSRGRDPQYPLGRRLGRSHSCSGPRGYKKYVLLLPGIEPQSPSPFFMFMSMGWNYVSELRLPTSLLLIPQVIYVYEEPRWLEIDKENLRTRR
jgi:hypothetical protein